MTLEAYGTPSVITIVCCTRSGWSLGLWFGGVCMSGDSLLAWLPWTDELSMLHCNPAFA